MVYTCNICNKNFNSSSFEDLNFFCKHVGSCPVRSENFLAERYKCKLCGSTVKNSWTYKKHLMKCQPPNLRLGLNSNQDLSKNIISFKQRREKGKLSF